MGYKYKTNHEYFHDIDSEYKAYILGLIYADGTIYQPKGNRQLVLRISLQEEDKYILEKFAKDVTNNKVIIYHPPSVKENNWKRKATVTVVSNILCSKLIEYGCNINKSRVGMNFPELKTIFIPHFIRGFLDGDGSIIIHKSKYKYTRKKDYILSKKPKKYSYTLRFAFSSTDKSFLEEIVKFLPIDDFRIDMKIRSIENYLLWIESRKNTKNVFNYLYKDANFYLKRKYNKVLEFNKIISSQAKDTFLEGSETT